MQTYHLSDELKVIIMRNGHGNVWTLLFEGVK
jgi:hypothetical protein